MSAALRTCPYLVRAPRWPVSAHVRGTPESMEILARLDPPPKVASRRVPMLGMYRRVSIEGLDGLLYAGPQRNTSAARKRLAQERGEPVGQYEVALHVESPAQVWYCYGRTAEEALDAADAELVRQGWTLL